MDQYVGQAADDYHMVSLESSINSQIGTRRKAQGAQIVDFRLQIVDCENF